MAGARGVETYTHVWDQGSFTGTEEGSPCTGRSGVRSQGEGSGEWDTEGTSEGSCEISSSMTVFLQISTVFQSSFSFRSLGTLTVPSLHPVDGKL